MALNENRIVNVTSTFGPMSVPFKQFGILLAIGDSDVINGSERIRSYNDLESVAGDFGVLAPEYLASQLYFSQEPKPSQIMIGRWITEPTQALLRGGTLTASEQQIGAWNAVTDGSFTVQANGVNIEVAGLDFSSQTNLNGVANLISEELSPDAEARWTGARFVVSTTSTGESAQIGYAAAATDGTDISAMLKLTSETALSPVGGFEAETPTECLQRMISVSGDWYAFHFASEQSLATDQIIELSGFVQGSSRMMLYGLTNTDARVLDSEYIDPLADTLVELNRFRTSGQFSPNDKALISALAKFASINFNANRSMITLMHKQQPGVIPENLESTQADTLMRRRYNVFARYSNGAAIFQHGVMFGERFIDEVIGIDWFCNTLTTELFNALYTSETGIDQTEVGLDILITAITVGCERAKTNGLIAEGIWNRDTIGALKKGSVIKDGYYVYAETMAAQPQPDRERRVAPPIRVAIKLAGKIHTVEDVLVTVNR